MTQLQQGLDPVAQRLSPPPDPVTTATDPPAGPRVPPPRSRTPWASLPTSTSPRSIAAYVARATVMKASSTLAAVLAEVST